MDHHRWARRFAVAIVALNAAFLAVTVLAQTRTPPPPPPPVVVPPPPTPNPPQSREFAWNDNATSLRGQRGATVPFHCPPGGSPATVWGTDVYTDDSSVCSAAVHVGLFDLAHGGDGVLRVLPGLPSYRAASRNGVTTLNYGAYPGSFSFVGVNVSLALALANREPRDTSWSDNAVSHRGRNGTIVQVRCAPGGSPGTVWGSGPYTDDSSICGAAVHAGAITLDRGGPVRIRVGPGLRAYRGTARNGVTSVDYGEFPGSFVVLRR